jgi:hypothetical protein
MDPSDFTYTKGGDTESETIEVRLRSKNQIRIRVKREFWVGEVIILRQHPLFMWLAFIHASVDLSTVFSDGHGSGGGLILSTPLFKLDCNIFCVPRGWRMGSASS